MNENQEIEKIAKKLYKKYKSAFDLVYKYAKPNLNAPVPNSLVELIEKNESLKLFDSSRSYVRFQPLFLYENIEKLKENGFISKDDDLKESWLFFV